MTSFSPANVRTPFSASSVLGGERVLQIYLRSTIEWIDLMRKGIPAPAIDAVMQRLNVRLAELSRALNIPERTLVRRKKEGVLNREESGKLLRLARVIECAAEVFEDGPVALDWMKSPNTLLGGATPLFMLDTDLGTASMKDTLGRIEHGVFA